MSDEKDKDPLGRVCKIHGVPFVNCGHYSVCPKCYMGEKEKP